MKLQALKKAEEDIERANQMVEAKQCSPPKPPKKVLMKSWPNNHKASKGQKDSENAEPPIQKVQKTEGQDVALVLADKTNSSKINTD